MNDGDDIDDEEGDSENCEEDDDEGAFCFADGRGRCVGAAGLARQRAPVTDTGWTENS